MAVLIDTGAMDIDSNIASPVRAASIRSDLSNVSFIDKVEGLPSNGPTKHAHLIDLGEYGEGVKDDGILQLQDAVATILYKASPDTLNSFLSPTVNTIKVVFGKKDVQLVIWRKGLEVFVGTFENHTSMKSFRFEHVAGFLIGYDGSWHLKVTASNAYSNTKWPDVWAGKFEDYGGVACMTVEVEDTDMAKRACTLAKYMLTTKFWEFKADIKTT